MRKIVVIFFLLSINALCASAQVPPVTEQQIENLSDLLESDTEDDQLLQQLEFFQRNPLNINTATTDELRQLRIISDLKIQNLLQYRNLLGPLLSIYELQAVPGWDLNIIKKISPFIVVSDPSGLVKGLTQRFTGGEHSIILRYSRLLEKAKGYNKSLNTFYPGSPDRLLFRYRYQYKNLLQWGITADKDAGEQFFNGAQSKGFDFYSAHFFVRRLGMIKTLALGDYNVNLGQGLIQWQSLAFKKSADAVDVKRQSPVLQPYSSAGEYNYNRGAGLTLEKGGLEATVFASSTPVSANRAVDTFSNEAFFSSFLSSGLHRTSSEVKDRNSVNQISAGGNIKYSTALFSIGVNSIYYQFSYPLQKRADPYNRFAAHGSSWINHSADFSLTYKNTHFFGEAALDKEGRSAVTAGAQIALDPKVDFALLYRSIGRGYASVYGNAFTENVMPVNEQGFYTGVTIRPAGRWRIDSYADVYRFPFIKFRTDAPSTGKDYLLQVTYKPNRQTEIYARYRTETKERNQSGSDSVLHFLVNKQRQNLRLHLQYQLAPSFALKTRSELVLWDKKGIDEQTGYLVYIEGAYKGGFTWGGNIRLQYFETEGYDSRLYAFESDVLYGYTIPPFFDKGFRYYVNLHYDINKKLTAWGRWSQTIYKDKQVIGFGLDEIKGNTRTEVKLQMRYVF